MKPYIGKFASTLPTVNGTQFAKGALEDIVRKQPTVPVTIDFSGHVVGNTTGFKMVGEVIFCEFELDEKREYPSIEHLYIVPTVEVLSSHRDLGRIVIDEASLSVAMLTYLPANLTQTKIKPK